MRLAGNLEFHRSEYRSAPLEGIPSKMLEQCLGNRSALEWVFDQYPVRTDKRSGITNEPNRPDNPEYIVRLLGQVSAVSVEMLEVVAGLPAFGFRA